MVQNQVSYDIDIFMSGMGQKYAREGEREGERERERDRERDMWGCVCE